MSSNFDIHELEKFSDLADRWWDLHAEFKALHAINPLRLDWITSQISPGGRQVLDVGCGGGILSEALAACSAQVKGIDLSPDALHAARLHACHSGLNITYENVAAETLAQREPGTYDIVTCMEMLEHVPDPAAIVNACAKLAKPGGWLFFSTINRHVKAYFLAIIAAEYLTRMLPRGTHDYERFIRPAELAAFARTAGLEPCAFQGIRYHPIGGYFSLCKDMRVNYLLACRRVAA